MKKSYIKPRVDEIKVDSKVIRMLTKQGFIDLFWEELQESRKTDPSTSQEAVFNNLNEKYFKAIGSNRYSSFDSFRICRDKK